MVDVWKFFKQKCRIKDFIIPQRKDRFNNRFGFIVTESRFEAAKLLEDPSARILGGKPLKMDWAREKKQKSDNPRNTGRGPHVTKTKYSGRNNKVESNDTTGSTIPHEMHFEDLVFDFEEKWCEEINRSSIVETAYDMGLDYLYELLLSAGIRDIEVRKVGWAKFIFTCQDEMLINEIDWENLVPSIVNIRKAIEEDYVIPRITWLKISGIPMFAFKEDIIRAVVRRWGTLVSSDFKILHKGVFVNPKICVSTTQNEAIKELLSVKIGSKSYKVHVEEDRTVILSHYEDVIRTSKKPICEDLRSTSIGSSTMEKDDTSVCYTSDKEDVMNHDLVEGFLDTDLNSFKDKSENANLISPSSVEQDSIFTEEWIDPMCVEPLYRVARLENWNLEIDQEKEHQDNIYEPVTQIGRYRDPAEINLLEDSYTTTMVEIIEKENHQETGLHVINQDDLSENLRDLGTKKKGISRKKRSEVQQREISPDIIIEDRSRQPTIVQQRDLAKEILDVGLQIGLILADNQDEVLLQIKKRLEDEV